MICPQNVELHQRAVVEIWIAWTSVNAILCAGRNLATSRKLESVMHLSISNGISIQMEILIAWVVKHNEFLFCIHAGNVRQIEETVLVRGKKSAGDLNIASHNHGPHVSSK